MHPPFILQVSTSLCKHYPLEFNLADPAMLQEMEQSFADRSKSKGVMRGCVGALDGIAIRINCPSRRDDIKAASYFNRKGFYSVNCQAICDGNLIFRWMSIATAGATHDSTAFGVTRLARLIRRGYLPDPYWIAAGAAYVADNSVLTPFPGSTHIFEFPMHIPFKLYLML